MERELQAAAAELEQEELQQVQLQLQMEQKAAQDRANERKAKHRQEAVAKLAALCEKKAALMTENLSMRQLLVASPRQENTSQHAGGVEALSAGGQSTLGDQSLPVTGSKSTEGHHASGEPPTSEKQSEPANASEISYLVLFI